MADYRIVPDDALNIVTIKIARTEIDREILAIAGDMRSKLTMPPHPKGECPVELIAEKFEKVIRPTATDNLLRKHTGQAIYSLGLRLGAEPTLRAGYGKGPGKNWAGLFDSESNLEFVLEWRRPARIELRPYRGLRLPIPPSAMKSDIDGQLRLLQRRVASNTKIDGPAKESHTLCVDIEGFDETGTAISGASYKNYVFTADGSDNYFGEELAKSAIGKCGGEQYEYWHNIPADHPDRYIAGKNIKFVVSITDVNECVLPDLDDSFAQAAAGCSMDELIKKLEAEWQRDNPDEDYENRYSAICKMLLDNDFPLDEKKIEKAVEREFSRVFSGVVSEAMEEKARQLREKLREHEERAVKMNSVIDAIYDENVASLGLNEQFLLRVAGKQASPGVTAEEHLNGIRSNRESYSAFIQYSQRMLTMEWLIGQNEFYVEESDGI